MKNTPIVEIPSVTGRVYLVEGGKGLVLIDALTSRYGRKILKTVAGRASAPRSRVNLILITHAHIDHYGGALDLRKKLDAPIAIHRLDAEWMRKGCNVHLHPRNLSERVIKVFVSRLKAQPVEPDILLDGEEGDLEEYGIEAKWIRTPGHTEGSISVVFPGEVAIVGDLVVGRFGVSRKPAYPLWVKDPQQLRDSIRKVLDFSPKVLLSGHGGPFSSEDVERVFFG